MQKGDLFMFKDYAEEESKGYNKYVGKFNLDARVENYNKRYHPDYPFDNIRNFVDPDDSLMGGATGADLFRAGFHPEDAFKSYQSQKRAKDAVKLFSKGSSHNNSADAYKHAYWMMDMYRNQHLDKDTIMAIGEAHETKPFAPEDELNMDLYNNKVALDIVSDPANQEKDIDYLIRESISKGYFQTNPTRENARSASSNWIQYDKEK